MRAGTQDSLTTEDKAAVALLRECPHDLEETLLISSIVLEKCIYFVQDPQGYDVIVTDNLFGDILTDLGGAVSGGIGLAASANLNPARTGPSMFEPVHGSAPDIAGTGVANPTAAILSAAMMLDFLGENDAAARIRDACADPVTGSTTDVGDTIASRVRS